MKHLIPLAFAGCLLAFTHVAQGQQRLTGRVVDASTGQPVPYASIGVLRTTLGTTSNAEGEFELRNVPLPGRLVVSELGHGRDTVAITASSASQLLQVRLTPTSVLLPEALVGSYAAELIAQAYRELRRTNAQKTYGQAFYRQTTRLDNDVTEVQEMVWHAQTSNARVDGTALAQGRFAKKKALISFKDFSLYTKAVTFFDTQDDSATYQGIISLHTADKFKLNVQSVVQNGPQQLVEIGLTPLDPASRTRQGSVVIDAATHQILRVRLATTGIHTKSNNPVFKFKDELTQLEFVFGPRPGGAAALEYLKINYQASMGRPLKSDFNVQVDSFAYFYNGKPGPASGITYAPAKGGEADLAAIKQTTYDPAFWRDNPVVKRTPLEEETMRAFEQKGAFGTLLTP
ncbi:MAG: carboxypeptidase-like regulatory domain-containing protein [Hymenobacter sp.]|nr:MAG: carboxypeptidase-like regulatory domain-containing protein [Hymenobacter sp.]